MQGITGTRAGTVSAIENIEPTKAEETRGLTPSCIATIAPSGIRLRAFLTECGSEIEFKKGLKIDNYDKSLEESGRAYFGDHIEGSVNTTDFGVYSDATGEMATTLNSTLAKHIQKLNLIRRAVPALQKGQYTTEGCNGGMSYKRRYTDGDVDSYVLVAISSGATFTNVVKGTYVDLVTGKKIDASSGTLSTDDIGKGNMRVFVLQNDTADEYGATGKIGESLEYLK